MVFTSYGGLIPGQSEHDFFSCSSMPRNRELMRVFKDVGLVEQFGSGMSRILNQYDKSIFQISEHFIKVEFPFSMPKDESNGGLNDSDRSLAEKVLAFMQENPTVTIAQLAEATSVSKRKIERITKQLREGGIIVRVGSKKTGHWEIKE